MAIEILDALDQTLQPTERFLKDWFRSRRFAGSKDRRAIVAQVFLVQRHRASYTYRIGSDTARARLIAALLDQGEDVAALFQGGYGPAPLTDEERMAIAAKRPAPPAWVVGEYPEWLEGELIRAFGSQLPCAMAAMITRAPTDLRVNLLKAKRADLMTSLASLGIASTPTTFAPDGLRIIGQAPNLVRTSLYQEGTFEVQDEAAQIVACLCAARPGMRVLDLAAGAGGKSLALAAIMRNRGEIFASDIRASALEELQRRAIRAGISIIKTVAPGDIESAGPFDMVLVDAPCSGSGTWRRQPELRWRLTPSRLLALTNIQDQLLDQAAGLVRSGGRLVYATCSILPVENQDRISAFRGRHPAFTPTNLREIWVGNMPPGLGVDFRASPILTGTDGFYCAAFRRN